MACGNRSQGGTDRASPSPLARLPTPPQTLSLILQHLIRKRFPERGLGVITAVAGGEANGSRFFGRLIPGAAALLER